MVTSPINDFLIRIKNGASAKKKEVSVPYSKFKEEIAKVLVREGYLVSAKKLENDLIVELAYKKNDPKISGVKNVSTPSLHIYKKAKDLKHMKKAMTISVVSTPDGILSDREAAKKGLGGEVIAQVW